MYQTESDVLFFSIFSVSFVTLHSTPTCACWNQSLSQFKQAFNTLHLLSVVKKLSMISVIGFPGLYCYINRYLPLQKPETGAMILCPDIFFKSSDALEAFISSTHASLPAFRNLSFLRILYEASEYALLF